jgi:ATP synthase protein I
LSEDRASNDLDRRIAAAKAAAEPGEVGIGKPAKGYSQGARVLADLIGMPLGGAILGIALDYWLNTGHWLLLIMLVLAIVAAFRSVYRISKEQAE